MPEKQYNEQVEYTEKYFLPYLKRNIPNFKKFSILEIGCAEAGTLPFFEAEGHKVTGIEIDPNRARMAVEKNPGLRIIVGDISSIELRGNLKETFDLIIMREVIEHIPDKENTFKNLYELLNPNGFLFMSFPPKYSPFAGHQQVGRSILKFTPYIHLLPRFFIQLIVKLLKEGSNFTRHVKGNYATGMSICLFEKYIRKYNLEKIRKDLFLFRPIYKLRFGFPTIKMINIPFVREIICFGYEGLFRKNT